MLKIKGILNINIECDNCGYEESVRGVEIETSESDFMQETLNFHIGEGFKCIPSGIDVPTHFWICNSCLTAEPRPEWVVKFAEIFNVEFVDVTPENRTNAD